MEYRDTCLITLSPNGSINYNIKWNLFFQSLDMILRLNKRRSGLWQKTLHWELKQRKNRSSNQSWTRGLVGGDYLTLQKFIIFSHFFKKLIVSIFFLFSVLFSMFFFPNLSSCISFGRGRAKWFYVIVPQCKWNGT